MSRIVYIGTPEAAADAFAARVRTEWPRIDLFATNDRAEAFAQLPDCEALIGHHFQFDDALLAQAPRLRWLQSLTSGTDSILKLKALRSAVVLTTTRGIHGPQMSELVMLQMLVLTRDYPRMLDNQRARRWQRWPQSLLADKCAVIVGVGAIAEALAPRCRAFGMRVYGVSAQPRAVPGFERVYARSQLLEAAALADYLILIVPHSTATESLIDAHVLAAMKPTAYLINVARGGVLDEQALLTALRERRLAGAALDVFRQTPLPADSPLWSQERLILTPHIGGMSDVYLAQSYEVVHVNLTHFLENRLDALINVVPH